MLKEDYKKLREELDDLLVELDVPKIYWHQLANLNIYLSRRPLNKINDVQPIESIKIFRTFALIHELSPEKLTHFTVEKEEASL